MFDNLIPINNETDVISGLNNELKCLYIHNRFIKNNESIVFLVSNLYEATTFYQMLQNYTNDVLLFPMDEIYIYEIKAASPELKSTRLETLHSLLTEEKKIIVVNLTAYLKILPPKSQYEEKTIKLNTNQNIIINNLVNELLNIGYKRETLVNQTGEIAVRGFVIDVFPINEEHPIRLEFWGDTIESIRVFDESTQKTKKIIKSITIYANTISQDQNEIDSLINTSKIINHNILSYLNNYKLIVNDYISLENNYKKIMKDVNSITLDGIKKNIFDLHPLPNPLYFTQFDDRFKTATKIEKYKVKQIDIYDKNPKLLKNELENYLKEKYTIIISLSNYRLINKFKDELNSNYSVITDENTILENKINIINKKITHGFIIKNFIIISENDIFNTNYKSPKYISKYKIGTKIRDLNKIQTGDYVVHNNHGVGQYLGIKTIIQSGLAKDYIALKYRGNDKLYIPVEKIDVISKYSANEGFVPRLNKLGGVEWSKTKMGIRTKAKNIARSLLTLYAERESIEGYAFIQDDEMQIEFEKEFEFKDTADQKRATLEIKNDMIKSYPMDRLLCGDVGFGKTEVAFRAIFKAVMSGKQVALLCPTTILSHQHYTNALERFKSFAINIVLMNRFVSSADIKKNINKIKSGSADIVIGTHRILSQDIKFKNLGLLVIDEEQRFGVTHKEKIKQYKNNIDVLTLTATPIPRTLQMSIAGIRNLSLIETPPKNRYPIQTYVVQYNDLIIRDAIYKEKLRNGQTYILYNNVNNMESKFAHFQKLMPNIKIVYAHGQMPKQKLEKIMLDFYNHEYDVLICTTIIEIGIDIPNVNSIIIIDADRFGLSQLYQIRGRVGRGDKIAYCYLMYDKHKVLTEIAKKRLQVIKEFTELGSGFAIASRDLSIRGAGDILGSEQAGFIDSIGIDMFLRIFNEEIKKLKGEYVPEETEDESLLPLISVETSINDNYVREEELKIEIHKKINTIDSFERLIEVKNEIEDRFGKINEKMLIYMYEEWFERIANNLNIENINQTNEKIEIEIPDTLTNKLNIQDLFYEANKINTAFKFSFKKMKLIISLNLINLDKHFIYYLIELLEKIVEMI